MEIKPLKNKRFYKGNIQLVLEKIKILVSREKITEFFKLYLIVMSVIWIIIGLGTLILSALGNTSFVNTLKIFLPIVIIILLGMGIVSLLPLSEYSYAMPHGRGRAGANPAMLREGLKDFRKRRESKNRGIIFLAVGLTLIIMYFLIF